MKSMLLVIGSIIVMSSCTWVELTEQGKSVSIVDHSSIKNCQKVGHVSAKTRQALIAGSPRSKKIVANELQRLARNEAANIAANTLVAETPPEKGQQQFIAYLCYH